MKSSSRRPNSFRCVRSLRTAAQTRSAVDYTGGNGFPWFLPDGEHFLFAAGAGSGHMIIRVGSLSSTDSAAIGEADSNATYAAGRLLYLKGTSLMAQPFDLSSLRTSGEAEPIAEGVERFLDLVTVGAFTASNSGLLAYQTGPGGARKQLTWFDRTGKPIKTLGDPRAFFSIELSPDGRTLGGLGSRCARKLRPLVVRRCGRFAYSLYIRSGRRILRSLVAGRP